MALSTPTRSTGASHGAGTSSTARPAGVDLDALPPILSDTVAEATGRHARRNAVHAHTGGPAGNALLAAWTGIVLLVLSVAQLLTLFNVTGLMTWHVAIGALLVPPALAKTATTGWRLARYYSGHEAYVEAGPPPTLMRLLGPLVVLSTLALLASGITLVVVGQDASRQLLFSLPLVGVTWIFVHQACFAVWAGATSLHLLGRLWPALTTTRIVRRTPAGEAAPSSVPRRSLRVLWLGLTVGAAVGLAVVLVHLAGSWTAPPTFGAFGG